MPSLMAAPTKVLVNDLASENETQRPAALWFGGVALQAQAVVVQHDDAGQIEVVDVALELHRAFAARRERRPRERPREADAPAGRAQSSAPERPDPSWRTRTRVLPDSRWPGSPTQRLRVDLGW